MPARRSKKAQRPDTSEMSSSDSGPERLQKVLAAAGIGSRRECELLIVEGRVEVDGEVVTELGTKVDPTHQRIRVDGAALPRTRRLYFAVNKPTGVVCTNRDPTGRTRVVDLIDTDDRLFTVGRLDRTSEGLILVTNDGDFANRLTHPRYQVEKVYRVTVAGSPAPEAIADLRRGVHLAEGLVRVDSVRITRRFKQSTELEISLREGLNREIRRLLARIGHKVMSLKRIAIGTVRLSDLPVGSYRPLTRDELARLSGRGRSGRKTAGSTRGSTPQRNRKAARPAKSSAGVSGRRAKTTPAERKRTTEGRTEKTRRPSGQGSVIGGETVATPRKKTAKTSVKKATRKKVAKRSTVRKENVRPKVARKSAKAKVKKRRS